MSNEEYFKQMRKDERNFKFIWYSLGHIVVYIVVALNIYLNDGFSYDNLISCAIGNVIALTIIYFVWWWLDW